LNVRHAACTGAAICDNVFIVALLAECLVFAAELTQVHKQNLVVPDINHPFRVIESTTTTMHALFSKMLCTPMFSSHVYRAWMQASP